MTNAFAVTAEAIDLHLTKRALQAFNRSSQVLLASRLGRLALVSVTEVFSERFSADEQRRLAFARVTTEARRAGIEAEDWTVRLLIEMAMQKLRGALDAAEPKQSAMNSFYL